MLVFPNCKINLGLHITGKRADGFHNLETVFYPVFLQDALEIIPNTAGGETTFALSGIAINDAADNICLKAYQLLKKDFPQLPPVHMQVHKAIPIGAGLGGGSADGAFTLLLLNKKYNLERTQEQLIAYALQLGSDCPFFIINQPCLATGRGEQLTPVDLDLSSYKMVIVNPGIPINTGWAFSKLQVQAPTNDLKKVISQPVSTWKQQLTNDFEKPVFEHYPEIKAIKEQLYAKGALYASLSGSGSTVYGLFTKEAIPEFDFPDSYFLKVI